MALEINEIGIHFRVPDAERPCLDLARRADADSTEGSGGEPEREQIVDDCVRRVLQLLAARAER
jgi:hypothetical protein